MVVDDSVEMGRLLTERLRNAGHRSEFVTNGAEALNLCRTCSFDLVITDLRMEDVDGSDILAALPDISPATKVIIMTAFGSAEIAREVLHRGAYHYIPKPFQFSELLFFVECALAERLRGEQTAPLRVGH